MIQQHRHILLALAQRRHAEVDDVEPIVEVLAKRLGGDVFDQIAIGGGDHPHVDAILDLFGADPLYLPGLEKPEQQPLHTGSGLPNFIHEYGAAVRLLEDAHAIAIRPGETTANMTKELGFEQRF